MKILLVYSSHHFDPLIPVPDNTMVSTQILAKTLYSILSEIGDLTYIDFNNFESVYGKSFDLFVGIHWNFLKILENCSVKRSIYWAVDMHPAERNRILKQAAGIRRFFHRILVSGDHIVGKEQFKAIEKANNILLVGNTVTLNTYLKNGVSPNRIKLLNYGMLTKPKYLPNKITNGCERKYAYIAELGIRKGFDIVFDVFENAAQNNVNFHLDIIGRPTAPYYKRKLDKLIRILGDKMTYYGWVSSTKEYVEIVQKNDFLFFPSLEEGQAGTVITALFLGLIPIITDRCGIDFSPMGFLEPKMFSKRNHGIFEKSNSISNEEIEMLYKETCDYYNENHTNFEADLRTAIISIALTNDSSRQDQK